MTEILSQVSSFKFKFDNKRILQEGKKSFYNLDYYSNYNDFSKLIFNQNFNQFEKQIGFGELDDNLTKGFGSFFGYEITKKIKPIRQKNIITDNYDLHLKNIIKDNFNCTGNKDSNKVSNNHIFRLNVINNFIQLYCKTSYFNYIYVYDNYYNHENLGKKTNPIVELCCFECEQYYIYLAKLNSNSFIQVIEMKNYKQDIVLVEDDKLIFIDKINNKVKIIYKQFNLLISNYLNYNSIKLVVDYKVNKINNNIININVTNEHINFIILEKTRFAYIVCRLENNINFDFSNNSNIIYKFEGDIIDNKFVINSLSNKYLLIDTYYSDNDYSDYKSDDQLDYESDNDLDNECNEKELICKDIKFNNVLILNKLSNSVEFRKKVPIEFSKKSDLIKLFLNPNLMINKFELVNKINFISNKNIFPIDNAPIKFIIEVKSNLSFINLLNDKYEIYINIANIDSKYSICKYNKLLDNYYFCSNEDKIPILTFEHIQSILFNRTIGTGPNKILEQNNIDCVLLSNDSDTKYTGYKLKLNDVQKNNLSNGIVSHYLLNFISKLYNTNLSIYEIDLQMDEINLQMDKINLNSQDFNNGYFDYLFDNSKDYIELIKKLNSKTISTSELLDLLFGVEKIYGKININEIFCDNINKKYKEDKDKDKNENENEDDGLISINFSLDKYSISKSTYYNPNYQSKTYRADFTDNFVLDKNKNMKISLLNNNLYLESRNDDVKVLDNVFDDSNYINGIYNPKTLTIINSVCKDEYYHDKNINYNKKYTFEQLGKLNENHFIQFIKKKIIIYIGENFDKHSDLLKSDGKLRYKINSEDSSYEGLAQNDSLFFDLDFLDNKIKIIIKKIKQTNFINEYLNLIIDKIKIDINKKEINLNEIIDKYFRNYIDDIVNIEYFEINSMLFQNTNILNFCKGESDNTNLNKDKIKLKFDLVKNNNMLLINLSKNNNRLLITMLGLDDFFGWIGNAFGSSNNTNTNKVTPTNTLSHLSNSTNTTININGKDVYDRNGSEVKTKKIRVGLIENKPQYVWKVCKIKDTNIKCLVKLELEPDCQYIIPSDSSHFLSGKNRCDKAKVLGIYKINLKKSEIYNSNELGYEIEDEEEYLEETIAVPIMTKTYLEYKKSSIVYADSFDLDISKTCTNGIHVFESKIQAINFANDNDDSGSNIPIQIDNIIVNIDKDKNQDKIKDEDKEIQEVDNKNDNKNDNEPNEKIIIKKNIKNIDKQNDVDEFENLIDKEIGVIKTSKINKSLLSNNNYKNDDNNLDNKNIYLNNNDKDHNNNKEYNYDEDNNDKDYNNNKEYNYDKDNDDKDNDDEYTYLIPKTNTFEGLRKRIISNK